MSLEFCKKCGKETERYPPPPGRKIGECVLCSKRRAAKNGPVWRAANLAEARRRSREYMRKKRADDPDKYCEDARRRRAANPDRHREINRDARGLPRPTRPCPEFCEWPGCTRKATHLDHCHAMGVFRGWLCNPHNTALGRMGDTREGLQAGIDYLTRAESEAWLAIPGNGLPLPERSK
jgi:hypothetical protein